MFLLASIHFSLHFNLRADLLAFAAALIAVLAISLFTNWSESIENSMIHALTRMMNHRRWFTFWLIGFFLWATVRSILVGYIDWDLIVITGAWSFWPFTVENIVKVSQGQTLTKLLELAFGLKQSNQHIAELTVEIKRQNDDAAQRDEAARLRDIVLEKALTANTEVLKRVLEAIEDRTGGGELASV